MISVKFITVGTLKEQYLKDAVSEYEKRLGGFCKLTHVNIKEEKLPDSPTSGDIGRALNAEADKILSQLSPRSYKIAMCVEGGQLSSEQLSERLDSISASYSEVCFVIGSSHGLSDKVKEMCDMKLSVSRLTFPHQLMRVILLEAVYRAFNISRGTNYHK